MTKTVQRTAFRYEELSEKVRDDLRFHDTDWHATECSDVSERLTDMLSSITGVSVESPHGRRKGDLTLAWSLGYCQGDGVAFYGSIDCATFAERLGELLADSSGTWWEPEVLAKLGVNEALVDVLRECGKHGLVLTSTENNTHYCHYNTMSFWFEEHGCPMAELGNTDCAFPIPTPETGSFKAVEEFLRDVSRHLEREGYDYMEALESLDNLKFHYAGGWFDEDGKILEWDDEDDREDHIALLEQLDSERIRGATGPE